MNKKLFLDGVWQSKHLKDIRSKAGHRYTPKLNVELPINEIFDGISRNLNFYRLVRSHTGKLNQEFRGLLSEFDDQELIKIYKAFASKIRAILKVLNEQKEYNVATIQWSTVNRGSAKAMDISWEFIEKLRTKKEITENSEANINGSGSISLPQSKFSEKLSSCLHDLNQIQKELRYFDQLSSSTTAKLSNHPYLLLTGLPGSGKTHLLCDVVERHTSGSTMGPCVMLFGELFGGKDGVWEQVKKQLGFGNDFSKEKFLKNLNDAGLQNKTRALILIDALNETTPLKFWKKALPILFKDIKKYPNISLIVSVRTGFELEVLSKRIAKALIEEEHRGFEFKEWEAIIKFFKEFSLPLPEIPVLLPEFQNPLFLLLFCKAFEYRSHKNNTKKNPKQIFRGHEGATYIFENFVRTIADKIAVKFKLKPGRNSNNQYIIWDTVIEKIAEEMVAGNKDRISEEKLLLIISKAHPTVDTQKFAVSLEKNFLLVKVPHYSTGYVKVIEYDYRFPFQKFSDHLISRYLFKKFRDSKKTPKQFFSSQTKIGKFIKLSWNRGIVDALSVECPEQLKGVEFFEIAPYLDDWVIVEAFTESILWRRPNAFTKDLKSVFQMINKTIIKNEGWHNNLLNALITIAAVPDHPLNAFFLHRNLMRHKMPERDAWWSTFLHDQYGEKKAVDRLIEWAWNFQVKKDVEKDSVKLYSIVLTWFLTTSDRFVRDKSTKALTTLLTDNLDIFPELLELFKKVDDPYLIERLYAVAYGCVLRNVKDKPAIKNISLWFLDNVFKKSTIPTHILIRDYAIGVVRIAIDIGAANISEKPKITPPFNSHWPDRIPSEKYLRKKYYPEEYFKDRTSDRGYLDIWSSVMYSSGSLADFGNYVVDSALSHWSGRRLNGKEPHRKQLLENFKKRLKPKQLELLEKINPFHGIDINRILFRSYKRNKTGSSPPINLDKEREKEKITFRKTVDLFKDALSRNKKQYFEKEIEPFLDERGTINDPLDRFDAGSAQRWIFNRVVKLGWNSKLHGKFDGRANDYRGDRTEHKPERIGKKYQWIAFHQMLGIVADNFEFIGDRWEDKKSNYEGAWQLYIRDIDPSCNLRENAAETVSDFPKFSNKPAKYSHWNDDKPIEYWLKNTTKLPDPKSIIELVDDLGITWIALEGFQEWQEETPPEYEKYILATRTLYYMIKSYLVKKKNKNQVIEWAKRQRFYNRWMPESHEFHNIYLGEYPNSPSFLSMYIPYYHHNEWTNNGNNNNMPAKILVTDDEYTSSGSSIDCSNEGSITVKLPAKWLVDNMKLVQKHANGRFYDDQNDLTTFDLRVAYDAMPRFLIARKDKLCQFLKNENYDIFWTILGEKETIGGGGIGQPHGWMEINGIYFLDKKNHLTGTIKTKFNRPTKQTKHKS